MKKKETCKELKDKYLDSWKRSQAEFLNYKKEEKDRMEDLVNYSKENTILEILPILDNIYLSEAHIPEKFKGDQWIKGLLLMKNQLVDFLKSQGVEEITDRTMFDPNFHEAIEEIESDEDSGTIIEEVKKGYTFNNKVIRPAIVKISK